MKNLALILALTLIFNCRKNENKSKGYEKTGENVMTKNLFDFDESIHYEYQDNDINLREAGAGEAEREKSDEQILKENIIIGKRGETVSLNLKKTHYLSNN